ncbi:MAG: hypothetical protein KJZ70_02785 [Bryobacterales bacterium]|nr:hypothetical protein [Bryobacterales bacterium]
MAIPGLAALLLAEELGFEAVEGGFVFLAEAGGAVVEAGGCGFLRFEEAEGDAGGGGGVGVALADAGDVGIGDDTLPGFEAAEEPGFLGDAEDEEFFGGGNGRVGADVAFEQGFEGRGAFVPVQEVRVERGVVERGGSAGRGGFGGDGLGRDGAGRGGAGCRGTGARRVGRSGFERAFNPRGGLGGRGGGGFVRSGEKCALKLRAPKAPR